jgi:hypothetical protein
MDIFILAALGLLTASTLFWRELLWLRLLTVGICVFFLAVIVVFGLWVAYRMGMSDDVALLGSKVTYVDAFKAGLLATQEHSDRITRRLLVVMAYLVTMALAPATRVKTKPGLKS